MGGWAFQHPWRHNVRQGIAQLARVPVVGERTIEFLLLRRYGPRVVTRDKARNFIQALTDQSARAIEVQSLPYHLVLDTINVCNLSCPFCPTGTGQLEHGRGRLTLARAKKVLDTVKPYALRADLYSWGEPYLDPDIFEITRYAHDSGLYTTIHSVLSVDKPDLGENIVASGLDVLGFTLDGLTQKTLEQYRRGAQIDLCIENIRSILKARKRLGVRTPKIELIFNIFRHNEHELPLLTEFAKALGVDAVFPRRAFIFSPTFIPNNPAYSPRRPEFSKTCGFLYTTLTAEADGHISPCDTNTSTAWNTGTLEDLDDFRRFWNQPIYQAMRAFHAGKPPEVVQELAGQTDLLCQKCSFVKGCGPNKGEFSPLPPSFNWKGEVYGPPRR